MKGIDARTRLIWRVRGTLGPEGHLILTRQDVNPAGDPALRAELVEAVNRRAVAARHLWADDRGLLRHGSWQLCDEPPEDVCTWDTMWDLVSPGITPERVSELNAAWVEGREMRLRRGEPADMRLHLAQCAFYAPPEPVRPVQLDMFDLIGAGHG